MRVLGEVLAVFFAVLLCSCASFHYDSDYTDNPGVYQLTFSGEGSVEEEAMYRANFDKTMERFQEKRQACYRQALAEQANLQGVVWLRFSIEPHGAVNNIKVDESSVDYPPLAECLVEEMLKLSFSKRKSWSKVDCRYPIRLQLYNQ